MKKLLLTAGILLLVACVLSFAAAVLFLLGYRHALDGSPAFYVRMQQRTILFAALGTAFAVGGVVCIVLYCKR